MGLSDAGRNGCVSSIHHSRGLALGLIHRVRWDWRRANCRQRVGNRTEAGMFALAGRLAFIHWVKRDSALVVEHCLAFLLDFVLCGPR